MTKKTKKEVLSQEITANALAPLELVAKAKTLTVERMAVKGGHLYITTYCVGPADGNFHLSVATSFVPFSFVPLPVS